MTIRFVTTLFLIGIVFPSAARLRGDEPPNGADRLPAFARLRLGNLRFQQGSPIESLKLASDGKTLIAVSRDGTARLWDAETGREVGTLPALPLDREEAETPVQFPQGGLEQIPVAVAEAPGQETASYCRITVSSDGRVAAVTAGKAIKLWDMRARKRIGRLSLPEGDYYFQQPVFTADGKSLLAIGQPLDVSKGTPAKLVAWNVATGKEETGFQVPSADGGAPVGVSDLLCSPDGKHVAVCAGDARIHLWDRSTGRARVVLGNRPWLGASRMAFSPDGKLLALGLCNTNFIGPLDADAQKRPLIRLIAVATGQTVADLGEFGKEPGRLVFSADGKVLATVEDAEKVRRWETATGHELPAVEGDPANQMLSLALSPAGQALALGLYGGGGAVQLRDAATGRTLHEWKGFGRQQNVIAVPIHDLLFSADGKTLFVSRGASIRRLDTTTGKEIMPAEGHADRVTSIAVSPDGRQLATLGDDGRLNLWEVATGRLQRTIIGPELSAGFPFPRLLGRVVFAPNGKIVAVAWANGLPTVHEVATGRMLAPLQVNAQVGFPIAMMQLTSLAFLPNSRDLVTGDAQGHVVQWDVATGKPRHWFAPNPAPTFNALGMMGMMGMGGMGGGTPFNPAYAVISPNGRTLAATAWTAEGFRIPRWELASRRPGRPIRFERLDVSSVNNDGFVTQLAFTPDGRTLAYVIANKVLLIDWFRGKEIRRFGRTATHLRGIAFSPDGKLLAAAGAYGSVHVWETATGTVLGELAGHRGEATSVAFLPDGRLVSSSADSTVLVWDVPGYLDARRQPGAGPSEEELRSAWKELADDPERADQAADRLAAAPERAVALIRREVTTVVVDPARIARLVADLESAQFAVRNRAVAELAKLGRLAEPALRKRLAQKPPLDVHRRIEELLEELARPLSDPMLLRALRAVALLERIGTPQAQEALRTLAEGAPDADLTRDARRALERLARKP